VVLTPWIAGGLLAFLESPAIRAESALARFDVARVLAFATCGSGRDVAALRRTRLPQGPALSLRLPTSHMPARRVGGTERDDVVSGSSPTPGHQLATPNSGLNSATGDHQLSRYAHRGTTRRYGTSGIPFGPSVRSKFLSAGLKSQEVGGWRVSAAARDSAFPAAWARWPDGGGAGRSGPADRDRRSFLHPTRWRALTLAAPALHWPRWFRAVRRRCCNGIRRGGSWPRRHLMEDDLVTDEACRLLEIDDERGRPGRNWVYAACSRRCSSQGHPSPNRLHHVGRPVASSVRTDCGAVRTRPSSPCSRGALSHRSIPLPRPTRLRWQLNDTALATPQRHEFSTGCICSPAVAPRPCRRRR